jgi:hypothetical protein
VDGRGVGRIVFSNPMNVAAWKQDLWRLGVRQAVDYEHFWQRRWRLTILFWGLAFESLPV